MEQMANTRQSIVSFSIFFPVDWYINLDHQGRAHRYNSASPHRKDLLTAHL